MTPATTQTDSKGENAMKMQVGKTYLAKNGSQEEVLLVVDGTAFCRSPGSKQNTLYGWDAETGKSLSLGPEYDISLHVTFAEVQP